MINQHERIDLLWRDSVLSEEEFKKEWEEEETLEEEEW